ncbi:sigma-70 family RNA polymerase sigma factor [Turicibacter sanguinis]|uniref:sigma-70 family RNA polymerase sigma factor n=1 Tax=Turicibacter sanguinis TaxID=154288 RepID=UPI0018AA4D84|nr:FliA/WhiG family RNA polymerase sigma factor [Turicibacter sanguinis]MDB8551127.1 FliA/WhiG family RNA polymerase sigma factor [Turicibacter sanguinis]
MHHRKTYYQSTNYQSVNIESYLPLVHRVVKQLNLKESSLIDYDDLFSIGIMGLLDAVEKYNQNKNASFETYARLRIRGAILDELRRVGILSRDKMAMVKTYYRKREELEQLLLRQPSDEEICEYMQIERDELLKIYLNIHYLSVASLDETIYESEGQAISLLHLLSDSADNGLNIMEKQELEQNLAYAISLLSERERYILNFYYVEELSVASMSEILNISISRVSQLHGKAIANLRKYLTMKKD